MNTHKVDVLSGYSYPQDKHALWFDESLNVLKKYDGSQWVSGSAVSNTEKNFYYKEEVVPSKIIWEGNAHSGDRIENFIQEPVAGNNYMFELSDGSVLTADWVDEEDFMFYGIESKDFGIGYRSFGQNDYGWIFINENNDANLVKISTEETTLNALIWNYQDSLPIAMPKCIEDDELGVVALMDWNDDDDSVHAVYIPYLDKGRLLGFIPMLFCSCGMFCLCGLRVGSSYGYEYLFILQNNDQYGNFCYIIKNDDGDAGGNPHLLNPGEGNEVETGK